MARPARSELPDGIYHAVARAIPERALYRDDADRRSFLALLALVVRRHDWRVLGFCLMGTHYHCSSTAPERTSRTGCDC
jgi:REP element-mobilizing transposase RayT